MNNPMEKLRFEIDRMYISVFLNNLIEQCTDAELLHKNVYAVSMAKTELALDMQSRISAIMDMADTIG